MWTFVSACICCVVGAGCAGASRSTLGSCTVWCAELGSCRQGLLAPQAGGPQAGSSPHNLLQQAPGYRNASTHGGHMAAAAGPAGVLVMPCWPHVSVRMQHTTGEEHKAGIEAESAVWPQLLVLVASTPALFFLKQHDLRVVHAAPGACRATCTTIQYIPVCARSLCTAGDSVFCKNTPVLVE